MVQFQISQSTKMKVIVIFAAVLAIALAAPQQGKDAVITSYESDNIGIDGYHYSFATSDGTSAQEQGQLKNAGSENEAIAVTGSFTFVGLDGQTYTVNYIADENGFQPQGAHLPKAP